MTKTCNEEIFKIIEELSPEAFDGHTEFSKLSADQKLEWLSEIILFCYQSKPRISDKISDGNPIKDGL